MKRPTDPFNCCGGNDTRPYHHCADCSEHPWNSKEGPDQRCTASPGTCPHAQRTSESEAQAGGLGLPCVPAETVAACTEALRTGDGQPSAGISVRRDRLGYRVRLPNIWAGEIILTEDESATLHDELGTSLGRASEAARPDRQPCGHDWQDRAPACLRCNEAEVLRRRSEAAQWCDDHKHNDPCFHEEPHRPAEARTPKAEVRRTGKEQSGGCGRTCFYPVSPHDAQCPRFGERWVEGHFAPSSLAATACAHPGTQLQYFDREDGDRIAAWCACCGAFRLVGYAQWHIPKHWRHI